LRAPASSSAQLNDISLGVNVTAGAFSGLPMGLNALATALLLPMLWTLLGGCK
jgi:putative effector of murein hydrolase